MKVIALWILIGLNGLLFSLYNSEYPHWGLTGLGSQTSAVFSNTTVSKSLYTQSVNRDTGLLYRIAVNISMKEKVVVDHFSAVDFHKGYFHLATSDGKVIVQAKLFLIINLLYVLIWNNH